MKMKKDQKYSKVESLIYNYYSKTRSFSCVTGNYGSKKTEIMHDTFLHYFFDFTKSKSIIGTQAVICTNYVGFLLWAFEAKLLALPRHFAPDM